MKIKIPAFEKAKVLVVGDVMLDRYWRGDVSRISPEAPIPVVHVQNIEERVGGAGNVAFNINALGGKASLLGLVGNDHVAETIEKGLDHEGIAHCLVRVPDATTICKLRVIGQSQQLIRLDFEKHFGDWGDESFFNAYITRLTDSNLVILSDYGKGTLQHSTKLIELARKMQKPVLVDPKSKDFSIYRGATVIKPNMAEFEAVVGHCRDEAEIESKARQLLQQYNFEAILITRGAHGMSLVCKDKPVIHLPTKAREVYDVTGAGDTVIAALGAAMAAGEELHDAMLIANIAAGEVVKKLGTSTISISELRRAMQHQQNPWAGVVDEEHLLQQVKDARAHGEKIVVTNGCFDILHSGHVIYLEKAKALGQRLIVIVNDDASVSRLKGPKRPINKVQDRMLVLAALGSVDWVALFSEDTPERLIKLINPDILVKGGDYKVHEIAGSDHVLSQGNEVVIIPFEDGFSTTLMLDRIKD
ncbi:MAG: bifunctional D-glycero-beta-D-manno-heptose-7-phosphate kinase/D-glycero-beta-D-manno-heptose 1-phosphate adenylyltransferase HldE [Gammaproteobacteria bacterium]|nr:bifunctional D-glycero-beta-D-manno-heptose-7-phosphate kinase/D-glycero-beta-D-manno-heptose 1-phosphate adenylyltransferase HldE [Gammaproteobacteria bacterium]